MTRRKRPDGMSLAETVAYYERLAVRTDDGCLELQSISCNPRGYPHASVPGNSRINRRVGQMVLWHYVGKAPEGCEMLHSCHNRKCIERDHLRWGTHRENIVEMVLAGRQGSQKLSTDDVRGIRWLVRLGWPQADVARMLGLSVAQVCRIVNRVRWAHLD